MRNRIALFGGLAALSVAALLVGCDPKKDESANTSGVSAPTANTAAPGSMGTTTASTTPTATAFDQPKVTDANAPLTIQVITNGTSPFWESMGKGLDVGKKEANLGGPNYVMPSQSDNNSQKDAFEKALTTNPNGVAISVIDPAAFAPEIDRAIDSGVPVITYDSDVPTSKRLAYIGTNNYDAGKLAGEAAVKLMPQGGNLVAFVGNMSADNAKQRYQGFVDATKSHNITMLQDPFEDDKDKGRAQSNVTNAISKYGAKLNGVVGLYSYNGPAIVSAVQSAGLMGKMKIICFDCEPQTVENLKKNLVDVTIVQKPYEFGRISALLLGEINRKGLPQAFQDLKPQLEKEGMKVNSDTRNIDTGVTIVTKENSDQFLKDLNAKGLTSS